MSHTSRKALTIAVVAEQDICEEVEQGDGGEPRAQVVGLAVALERDRRDDDQRGDRDRCDVQHQIAESDCKKQQQLLAHAERANCCHRKHQECRFRIPGREQQVRS